MNNIEKKRLESIFNNEEFKYSFAQNIKAAEKNYHIEKGCSVGEISGSNLGKDLEIALLLALREHVTENVYVKDLLPTNMKSLHPRESDIIFNDCAFSLKSRRSHKQHIIPFECKSVKIFNMNESIEEKKRLLLKKLEGRWVDHSVLLLTYTDEGYNFSAIEFKEDEFPSPKAYVGDVVARSEYRATYDFLEAKINKSRYNINMTFCDVDCEDKVLDKFQMLKNGEEEHQDITDLFV